MLKLIHNFQEPGQGRRASRPPSLLGSQFELGIAPLHEYPSGSQRSNVFPWDHAGASSSVSGAVPFSVGVSGRLSFGRDDSRVRGSSLGRDSFAPGVPESPASFGLTASHRDNAFEFDGEPVNSCCLLSSLTVPCSACR